MTKKGTVKEKADSKLKEKNKKKKSVKRNKHVFGVKEFIFNFISIVFALGILLYFGGRCFYYYSLQSQNKKDTGMTLNGLVMNNNKLVKEGDGLYKREEGYYFKGNVSNNYVWFANRMFRVLGVNDDNSVKLVSEDLGSIFMWGEEDTYEKSNLRVWLTNTGSDYSGVYYNTIPSQDKFIKKTNYTLDKLKGETVDVGKKKYSDNVVSLSLDDYIKAGGKKGFLNNGKLFYLLGFDEDGGNLYVEEDGSIMSGDKLDAYGVRAVITMNKNMVVSQGDGSVNNPYTIDQGKDVGYVDSYVKLSNDVWKVTSEKDGVIKMYLNGYVNNSGVEVFRQYSLKQNQFDYSERSNIGYYLINEYLNSLPYKDFIVNNMYPLGEVSVEVGYNYQNIYSNQFEGPVSLLNLFDYVSNNELNDFYRNNVTSSVGNIQYITYSNGIAEEADITDEKHIVPVISINTSSIKSGSGRIDDPYIVG